MAYSVRLFVKSSLIPESYSFFLTFCSPFDPFIKFNLFECTYTYVIITVTVITQPDNTTVCEGGTAVFTCTMNITNATINTMDAKWWRIRTDLNNDSVDVPVSTHALPRLNINNSISQNTLTSVLMITNVKSSHIGPYWCVLMITNELTMASNMAFLNIVPNGSTLVCMLHACIMYICKYVYIHIRIYICMYVCMYVVGLDNISIIIIATVQY